MAKNQVSDWDLNADNNTDVSNNNIAENCPPAGINNAIRAMMAQVKAWYNNVPRLDATNTFTGNNSFSNPPNSKKYTSSVASGESNANRGFNILVDGNEQFNLYYDNLKTVLTSGGTGFFTGSAWTISGRALNMPSSSASVSSDRGVHFSIDGVEYGIIQQENGGQLHKSTGYIRQDVDGNETSRFAANGFFVGRTSIGVDASTVGSGVTLSKAGLIWANRSDAPAQVLKRGGSNGDIAQFVRDTTLVGSISVTGASTSYNTTSDERLKTDFREINPSSVEEINVYDFEWKSGQGRSRGVKAQELAKVRPDYVTPGQSEKDYWQVDYSKMVPELVASIKDLRKRVAELEK